VETKKVVAAAVVVAAVAVVAYLLIWRPRADDDRPDIIVSNRKLSVQTDKDWQDLSTSGRKWKPDHQNGRSVAEYEVSGTNAKSSCAALTGQNVQVDFTLNGATQTLTVGREANTAGKYEPVVDVPVDFEHAGNRKKLRIKLDPDAAITALRVGSSACEFPNDASRDVEIKLKMKY
jgi:hypothetical protein